MARRKYVKENNLVKAINTDSLELQKPLVNEYYDINVHNSNMDKIDLGYKQNKNDISNINYELSKTENTKYSTENGVKEFECKNGYVDNIVIEGQTKILNAENIEVEAGTDSAKLVSVGQGDKIEVLTYQGENLFDGTYDIGYFNSVVGGYIENLATDVPTKTTKWIACKPNTLYHLIGGNRGSVQIKNNNTIIEYKGDYETQIVTPSECTHFRVYYERVGQFSLPFRIIEGKQDKKQILTTLRSLPNGVKDTIEKRGNKYYKIKRCEEVTLNGGESWEEEAVDSNGTYVSKLVFDLAKLNSVSINDKLPSIVVSGKECLVIQDKLYIRVLKTKLSTQNITGFKTWLSQNPVTVVYELETPIIEELPNFNPQTFSDKTTLLLNSGAVQGEANFEVTNSLGSELEVLKDKVSDLDDEVNPSKVDFSDRCILLNSWGMWGNNTYLSAYLHDNQVKICMLLTPGVKTAYTKMVKVPKEFAPINVEFITAITDGATPYSFSIDKDGYISSENTIGDCNWISINFSYPLPRK